MPDGSGPVPDESADGSAGASAGQRPKPVVVVGSINLDELISVEHHPAPGETVPGRAVGVRPGGKGGNQAVAAARSGARVTMIGRIGADAAGAAYRANLARRGIDVTHVRTTAGQDTGRAVVVVSAGGENTIVVLAGANGSVTAQDLDPAVFRDPVVLLVQFELPDAVVGAATDLAAAHGGRVVLNPSPARALAPDLLRRADPLVVNQNEAADLTSPGPGSANDPPAMAAALLARGARSVVITLGAAGAVVAVNGATDLIPAPAATVVDTTGAGDVFAGALAAHLARGAGLSAAARAAVAAASRATGWVGAQEDRL